MRKIIVLSMITLDGVMQGPGGPEEDTSGSFTYGGWTASYSDELFNQIMQDELKPAHYLLGRKTFEIFESYWPKHAEFWPGINEGTKYVLSQTREKSDSLLSGEKDKRTLFSLVLGLDLRFFGVLRVAEPYVANRRGA